MEDIAVVGYGCLLPEAEGSEGFWQNLLAARCSIQELPEAMWDRALCFSAEPKAADNRASPRAGFVAEAALERAARRLGLARERFNRLQIMTLAAAEEAMASFRRPLSEAGRSALYLGCMEVDEDVSRRKFVADEWGSLRGHVTEFCGGQAPEILSVLWDDLSKWSPASERDRPRLFTSSILSLIQERFLLPGEAALVDAACASSLAAVDLALRALRTGHADLVVTGGIDANLGPGSFALFGRLGALAPERCLPLDRRSQGLSQGEGAVVIILERLADAERLGHPVHGILKGAGSSSDGSRSSLFAPTAEGQLRAMHRAYEGFDPATIDYVECHATGTSVGDQTELLSLARFFDDRNLPVGSVKALVGHTKGAAGAVSLLKCLLSLKYRTLPPSPYCRTPLFAGKAGPFVNRKLIELRKRGPPLAFGVSSFGFGGINYHLVLQERGREPQSAPRRARANEIPGGIVLVGKSQSPTAGSLNEIVASMRIPRRSIEQIDAVQRAALTAAIAVFEALRLDPQRLDRSAVSVISASTLGLDLAYSVSNRVLHFALQRPLERFGRGAASKVMAHQEHHPPIGEDSAPGSLNNVIAGRVCNYFDFTGASFNIDADLASFPAALRMAELLLCDRDGLVVLLAVEEHYNPARFRIERPAVACWLLASVAYAKRYNLPIEARLAVLEHSAGEAARCL